MSKKNYDVIIIGAGFAGVTAARELSQKGHKVLVIEAEDRLGGRTWYDERLGRGLEIGGTWVHWSQPHVWAEITRYNLETTQSPTPEKTFWFADGKLQEGDGEALLKVLDRGMNKVVEDARKYFSKPYEPLRELEALKEVDHISIADKLRSLDLTKEEFDANYSMWAVNFNGSPETAALTHAYRWVALTNYDWQYNFESCATYKLKNGTKELIEKIANDSKAEFQFSKPVSQVEKVDDEYRVITKSGEEFYASAVIVTLPINILNSIKFTPELSEQKQAFSKEGQNSTGVKYWARVRGQRKPFIAMAPADSPADFPINFIQYEYNIDEDSIYVGFGPDHKYLDPENREEVERALRKIIPDVEVIESAGYDWSGGEFSGQTWPMYRTNQLTKYFAELQRPEEGIFYGGGDGANGWLGFIDGAIENALRTSKLVDQYITKSSNSLSV